MQIKKVVASLFWELEVTCPGCNKNINLANYDSDGFFSKFIFNNNWQGLTGELVECPFCDVEFEIGEVEL